MNPLINIPATKVFLETWQAVISNKYKLICQEGSSRSSKTWSDFLVIFKYNYENTNKVTTVLRDTATDCRDILESEWVKWLADPCGRTLEFEDGKINVQELNNLLKIESLKRLFNENKTKHIWTFKSNNSSIRFTGLDDDDKVMGMTQNVCWVNEPYLFSHEVYRQLSQRTSDFMLIDWNPKLKHWIDIEKKRSTSIVLTSTFKDNPFCPPKQKEQILSYQPVSMCDVVENKLIDEKDAIVYDVVKNDLNFSVQQIKELLRCRLNEAEKTASAYHWSVFGLGTHAERPNRIYNWDEISLNDYILIDATEYFYSDWGSVDPWAVGAVKYYDGALYVRELNYNSENIIREKMTDAEREQANSVTEGLVTWMFTRLNIPFDATIICDTNRPAKILALRAAGWEYTVGLIRRETGAGKPGVIDGIDSLRNIKVYYTGENIKNEQENYSRKVDKYGAVLEEPEGFNNHHMDGIKYVNSFLIAQGVYKKV